MANGVRDNLNKPSNFARALNIVIRLETGGRADGAPHHDPHDPGGTTKWGISIRFAGSIGLDLDGDGKTTNHDVLALTREYAAEIYREHFWDRLRCDAMPYGLALAAFDCAVNQGVGTAAKRLQRAAGVADDGFVGPVTLAAIARRNDRHALLRDFMARRGKRYAETPNIDRYGRGWFTRLLEIHEIAGGAL